MACLLPGTLGPRTGHRADDPVALEPSWLAQSSQPLTPGDIDTSPTDISLLSAGEQGHKGSQEHPGGWALLKEAQAFSSYPALLFPDSDVAQSPDLSPRGTDHLGLVPCLWNSFHSISLQMAGNTTVLSSWHAQEISVGKINLYNEDEMTTSEGGLWDIK